MQYTKPYLVGITGGSASGKTRFLSALSDLFKEDDVCVLSQDNYYKPALDHAKDSNGHINYDLPQCIDMDRFYSDIHALKNGQSVNIQEYRFQHEEQFGQTLTIKPASIIITEGLFIFYDERIRNLFDLSIFIEADAEVQFSRRLKRDMEERNIPADFVKYQWDNHVMPAYHTYLLPYRAQADMIITNNTHFNTSLKVVADHFKAVLKS
ncbi:MAG: uridine kinase [Bacteroidota bacterium]|jgi:uridine kinase